MNRSFATSIACFALLIFTIQAHAQTSLRPQRKQSASERIARATKNINRKQTYQLAYKLKKGDELRWEVEQTVATKHRMAGKLEESKSRSVTTKLWKVANVDSLGQMTFVHSFESADMWQQVGEGKPITYNSETDKEAPSEYSGLASQLGRPIAVFSIKPNGEIFDRKSNIPERDFGAGKVTIPLPDEAIPVGHKWSLPTKLTANDERGSRKQLNARILYELTKVKGQHAYIKFRTEVLTPVTSEKIRSTIMQQLTDGYVVFDMEKGIPILKTVQWDEKAQGFEGADSFLKYVGQMSEKFVVKKTATKKTSSLTPMKVTPERKIAKVKLREDAPIMRRN